MLIKSSSTNELINTNYTQRTISSADKKSTKFI